MTQPRMLITRIEATKKPITLKHAGDQQHECAMLCVLSQLLTPLTVLFRSSPINKINKIRQTRRLSVLLANIRYVHYRFLFARSC